MTTAAKLILTPVFVLALAVCWGPAWGQASGDDWADDWEDESSSPVEIHGFAEAAVSGRYTEDPSQPHELLANEARFRLDLAHYGDKAEFYFKGDFLSDELTGDVDIDVRQAVISVRLSGWLDVRAGEQILTWGTGDLVFLNDLFPKDFVSFFVGRDDEYLKSPSNSIKLTFYTRLFNADVAWTPVFSPDRYITGERLSFFNPMTSQIVSASTMGGPLRAPAPNRKIDNGELALRLFRNVEGLELALYGYAGFTKQPLAFDPERGTPAYTPLWAYGASARFNLLGGIANLEGAYHDSRDDRNGGDPYVPNSQTRGLAGYERELFANFTGGFQYYTEWTADYAKLTANLPDTPDKPEEMRHLVTTRLTYRLLQETLTLSTFIFYSPNGQDGHARPLFSYKWSDAVTVAAGANVMFGEDNSFFGQLENNSNVYLRLRYSF
jgi:hypothetical protein